MSIQVASAETPALHGFPSDHRMALCGEGLRPPLATQAAAEIQMHRSGGRERACAGCRKVSPAATLLRFVCSPTRELILDLRARLPGRGAWVCPTLPCLELGLRKRGFARCLRAPVHADATTLSRTTQEALRRAVLQNLGLCYRSSQCDFGRDRCLAALAQGNVSALVFAHDLSERSARQLLQQESLQKSACMDPARQKLPRKRSLCAINEHFGLREATPRALEDSGGDFVPQAGENPLDSTWATDNEAGTRTEVIKTHFSKRELGQALGRQEVGIISVLHGKLACKLLSHLYCLHQLQTSLQHKQSPLRNL